MFLLFRSLWRQDQSIRAAARCDGPVVELSFYEMEFRVDIDAMRHRARRDKRKSYLQFRIRPIMILHTVLSGVISGLQSTTDIVTPPACLFGTTAIDLCSAILVRIALILSIFGTTRRLALVLHHDAAPACIRTGWLV